MESAPSDIIRLILDRTECIIPIILVNKHWNESGKSHPDMTFWGAKTRYDIMVATTEKLFAGLRNYPGNLFTRPSHAAIADGWLGFVEEIYDRHGDEVAARHIAELTPEYFIELGDNGPRKLLNNPQAVKCARVIRNMCMLGFHSSCICDKNG
jgi:hypothetical protein